MPLLAQRGHEMEDFRDQPGRQTERRLVQKEDFGTRHQSARDRQHLLLAAREIRARLVTARQQNRERAAGLGDAFIEALAPEVRMRIGAEPQIGFDRQAAEHLAAFRHQAETAENALPRA